MKWKCSSYRDSTAVFQGTLGWEVGFYEISSELESHLFSWIKTQMSLRKPNENKTTKYVVCISKHCSACQRFRNALFSSVFLTNRKHKLSILLRISLSFPRISIFLSCFFVSVFIKIFFSFEFVAKQFSVRHLFFMQLEATQSQILEFNLVLALHHPYYFQSTISGDFPTITLWPRNSRALF